jgi:chromosomal replication initiator protein
LGIVPKTSRSYIKNPRTESGFIVDRSLRLRSGRIVNNLKAHHSMACASQVTRTESIWPALNCEIKRLFSDAVYEEWFASLVCTEESHDLIRLQTPTEFSAIWIQDNFLDLLTPKAIEIAGRLLRIEIHAAGNDETESALPFAASQGTARSRIVPASSDRVKVTPPPKNKEQFPLNPKNTFENFVIGGGNQLAHAACMAVANAPAKAYNPLFIYGETGLGKTHLMHAVAHHVLKQRPEAKITYISSEKFTNEFIRAIQENSLVKFRRHYRNVDVLLIDDVQFLSGKERIQEEFFHTFNELFEAQKQIFLTSDRPANEISKLENRLISRFQWGLVADIQSPDMETRLAILSQKAQSLNLDIPPAILCFLAERVSRNVRRLEGALTRVASYSALVRKPIDIAKVEALLDDILQEEVQNQVTIEKIQKKVTEHFNLRMTDMISKRRPSNIAFPRQIAMYLSRTMTGHSLQEIGDAFGGRDHGTVIHACKTVENMMEQDSGVRQNVDFLTKQLSKDSA